MLPKSPGRFAAVAEVARPAPSAFCEKSFPAVEPGTRTFVRPAERPLPDGSKTVAPKAGAWTWVNLWATWCVPCVREMPLLDRWTQSMRSDGLQIELELWSVDDDEAALKKALAGGMPGPVRWLRSQDDLPALLDAVGADRASAIPIHALIDPNGLLRCVRVGSVGEESYGLVRSVVGLR